ncbi:alpha-1A adrenergic receptor-like [Paramacrobiotus metropolitanus]|uniref:alpha-1A adrenergic receptor-like n=1 Tax=Paramacrobiotus metropolitanus TaxID=2943436 RepID=UPI002445937A|nr:alpha-1A adrenergic receptor-like [Paramacrobiotus metropolitanus]
MNISSNLSQTVTNRQSELVALVSVYGCAAVTGAVLSTTLFLTIILRPQLRTGSGILLAHHQLLHMLQTGIVSPFYIVTGWGVFLGASIDGINCTAMFFVCQIVICSEIWSSLFLAVNRLIALIFPHYYSRISSTAAIAGFIITAWVISVAVNLPGVFGIGSYFAKREVDCGYTRVTNQHIFNAVGILGKYLPLALQAVVYGVILFHHFRAQNGLQAAAKKRFNLFRLLLCSYAWYMACYAPYLMTYYGFRRYWFADEVRMGWFMAVQEIGYAGSPVFLLLMNKDIVKIAKEGLRIRLRDYREPKLEEGEQGDKGY